MVRSTSKTSPPYDAERLERAALDYAARYATTRAKLTAYLRRKLGERGWAGEGAPPVAALVERFAAHGYVDDAAYAAAKADALQRRGYGARRIGTALRGAGIESEVAGALGERIADGAEAAALLYARRKRIGPFATKPADSLEKRRWIATMARAGHAFDLILRILAIDPDAQHIDPEGMMRDGKLPESE